MTKKDDLIAKKIKAIEYMNEYVKPGDTVYTMLRHVSSSGMSRTIRVFVMYVKDNKPHIYDVSHLVSDIIGYKLDKNRDGLKVEGCGMDMGFAVVHSLSYAMWPDGFDCIGEGCPLNDHRNGEDVKHHTEGGYALIQRWI
jgi:hypothetical protein